MAQLKAPGPAFLDAPSWFPGQGHGDRWPPPRSEQPDRLRKPPAPPMPRLPARSYLRYPSHYHYGASGLMASRGVKVISVGGSLQGGGAQGSDPAGVGPAPGGQGRGSPATCGPPALPWPPGPPAPLEAVHVPVGCSSELSAAGALEQTCSVHLQAHRPAGKLATMSTSLAGDGSPPTLWAAPAPGAVTPRGTRVQECLGDGPCCPGYAPVEPLATAPGLCSCCQKTVRGRPAPASPSVTARLPRTWQARGRSERRLLPLPRSRTSA